MWGRKDSAFWQGIKFLHYFNAGESLFRVKCKGLVSLARPFLQSPAPLPCLRSSEGTPPAARGLADSLWDHRGAEGAQHHVDVMGFGPSLRLAWLVGASLGSRQGGILPAVTAGLLFRWSVPAWISFGS